MSKRKLGRRRKPCGRLAPATPAPPSRDDGTPELQAIRKTILGEKANGLPLSHESPVDVLCARGYLTPTQVAAARAYQAARRAVYGASTARAATPLLTSPSSGRTTGPLARLQAKRNLIAWQRLIEERSLACQVQFYRYVCIEIWGAEIALAAKHAAAHHTFAQLAQLLDDIAETPRQHITADEIERAEIQEMIG